MASTVDVLDWNWGAARKFLPFDLDGLSAESGALTRRRGVSGGEALVRTLLLMGLPNSSFVRASSMAHEAGLAKMNGPALFRRLIKSESMLEGLFRHTLTHAVDTSGTWRGLRLLAVDATTLCGPGATGTDQRLHTVYDLGKGLPVSVDLTGPKGGETLYRHNSFGFGDLLLCDAGYGYNKSIRWALRSGARFLIRFNFATVRFFDLDGERIWAERIDAAVPETGRLDVPVRIDECPHPLRAVGERNLEGKVVWLLTDLSPEELAAEEARELYRKRWQVELFFKRLKSLLNLDELPTRDGPTARAWVWAKLTLASLAVLLAHERFSPWEDPNEQSREPLGRIRQGHLGHRKASAGAFAQAQTRQAKGKVQKARPNPQTALPLEA
jgi:hypothetical protein